MAAIQPCARRPWFRCMYSQRMERHQVIRIRYDGPVSPLGEDHTQRDAVCTAHVSFVSLSFFFSGNLIVRLIISLMIDEPAIRIPGTKNDPAQRLWSSTETFNDPSCSVSLLAHAPPLRELQAEYYFNYVRDSLRAMTRCAEV